MWWEFLLIFMASFLFDVVPFPFFPAFTIMVFLQILFGLNIWLVIVVGVAGSVMGRYVLTLYIPYLADKIFLQAKNKDIVFLGKKLKEKGWKGQMGILLYSLLPLPTTPLFLAGGMAGLKPVYIIPAFFLGKFISDAVTVHLGNYAAVNATGLLENILLWKSVIFLLLFLILLFALLFIDWRTMLQKKRLHLNYKIWKHHKWFYHSWLQRSRHSGTLSRRKE